MAKPLSRALTGNTKRNAKHKTRHLIGAIFCNRASGIYFLWLAVTPVRTSPANGLKILTNQRSDCKSLKTKRELLELKNMADKLIEEESKETNWFSAELRILEAEYEESKLQVYQDTLFCKRSMVELELLCKMSNYGRNINSCQSTPKCLRCGVPQGTILGPLLFFICINDLPHCLTYSEPRMYADDTSLTLANTDIEHINYRKIRKCPAQR